VGGITLGTLGVSVAVGGRNTMRVMVGCAGNNEMGVSLNIAAPTPQARQRTPSSIIPVRISQIERRFMVVNSLGKELMSVYPALLNCQLYYTNYFNSIVNRYTMNGVAVEIYRVGITLHVTPTR
jgi:hypothetical protein